MTSDFQRALVTGASYGMGEGLCRLLADQGIDLIIVARSEDKLNALAEELRAQVDVIVYPCDVGEKEQRSGLVEVIYRYLPDLVVNNAGFGHYGRALSWETEVMMNMVEVNAAAVLEISLEAARALISAEKKGVILNVSSAAAFQIFPYFAVYAATKAFVNSFSESFDEEVKPYGVRVLATCPGMVDTQFRYRAAGDSSVEGSSMAMSVEDAAKEMWWQIQKGKPVYTFNWKYRVSIFLTRYLVPTCVLKWSMKRVMESIKPLGEIIKKTRR